MNNGPPPQTARTTNTHHHHSVPFLAYTLMTSSAIPRSTIPPTSTLKYNLNNGSISEPGRKEFPQINKISPNHYTLTYRGKNPSASLMIPRTDQ